MKAVVTYIRAEWFYWISTAVFLFALSALNAAVAAPSLTVDGVKFTKDPSGQTWYARYGNRVSDLDEAFGSIRVMWSGAANKMPVMVISGDNGKSCKMDLRLVFVKPDGEVRSVGGFNTCETKSFFVVAGYPITKVTVNGETIKFNLAVQ